MRDPQAKLTFGKQHVLRHLLEPLQEDHVLHSDQAQKWIKNQQLIPFKWIDGLTLQSPRVPFVSSPEEWTNAQLHDAAQLTLTLLEQANAHQTDLKDASAWNIIFEGCQPIFCDLTSFESLQTKTWWSAGQFVRHFISPLWLAQATGLQSKDIFRMSRDGAMPELVRNILGMRRFLSRCWPLVAASHGVSTPANPKNLSSTQIKAFRQSLVTSLRWMLSGVKPRITQTTPWAAYTEQRDHYTKQALDAKRTQVQQWLQQLAPTWTLDLGCNSGEFTQLALDTGSKVIAVDGDHDAVQMLYLKHSQSRDVYPVVAQLDDIHSGRGWGGAEHTGLAVRLTQSSDLVMMIALIHHLSIAAAIHLEQVAQFAAACTRRWLVVEFLEPNDPQVVLLCGQRKRNPAEFDVQKQRQAFIDAGFAVLKEFTLPEGTRHLALLERRP
jgi:hypothetical protein